MRMAIKLAYDNAQRGQGGPFGAVVVQGDRVLATGTNRVTATNDPTAHAEIAAIRQACEVLGDFQLTGCDLYTSCEPCPMCLGAIYWARPRAVYYAYDRNEAAAAGFDDSFIYEETALPPDARAIPTIELRDHGSEYNPFDAWIGLACKAPY